MSEVYDTDSKKRKQQGSPPQTPTSIRAAKRGSSPGHLDLGAVSSVQLRTTSQPSPDEVFSHPGPAPVTPSAARSLPLAPVSTVMAAPDGLERPFKASYSPAHEALSMSSMTLHILIWGDGVLDGGSVLKSAIEYLSQENVSICKLFQDPGTFEVDRLLARDDDLSKFLDDFLAEALHQNRRNKAARDAMFKKTARLCDFLCGEPLLDQSSNAEDPQVRKAIQQAWTVPYTGDMEATLLRSIRNGYHADGNADYSNTVTILQSSGTGKSRMVHEMRHHVFTLPFNLREDKDTEQFAFPPPDRDIRAYMTADVPNEAAFKNRCGFMFRVLFNFIRRWLGLQQPHFDSYGEAVHAWNVFADSKRSEIYGTIKLVLDSKSSLPDHQVDDATTQLSHLCQALHNLELPADKTPSPPDIDVDLPDVFRHVLSAEDREECKKHVQQDERNGRRLTPGELTSTVILIVYFDEAHVLANKTPSTPSTSSTGNRKTLYDLLLSVFNDFQTEPIFGVFPSNSLHIAQFAPPPTLARSARLAKSNRLKPPITEVPFDCGPLLPLQSNAELTLTIESVSSVYFMAQFGRPLFWAMMHKTHDPAKVGVEASMREKAELDVMRLAQAKLAGQAPLKDWRENPEDARLAVLDVRLCFDYETCKAVSANRESTLIASHMRLAYSVPEHRQYLRSGYSSEPILAEAAATLMSRWQEKSSDIPEPWNPLDSLAQFVGTGLIRRGDRGELVARYILMRAYDAGALSEMKGALDSRWPTRFGCTVVGFIHALFQRAIADKVLSASPDNVSGGEAFSTAFAKSSLRFTCFVKLGDSSGLTPEGLCAAFIRGVAFIGHDTQAAVDVILPVLVDRGGPITPGNMSCILIQIKARLHAGYAGAYDFTAEDLDVFGAGSKWPYVTLLMELGVQSTKGQGSPSKVVVAAAGRHSDRIATATSDAHPRYNIRAYGCSSTVYKVVDPTEKEKYRGLLLERDPTADHPREENLQHVWNMKPAWVYGMRGTADSADKKIHVNSYGWYWRHPKEGAIPEGEEGVVIANAPE